jgi:hypothetical protein
MRWHLLRLIKTPGKNSPEIGQVFVECIDEVFDNYRLWIAARDAKAYRNLAREFKLKLANLFHQWLPASGATALNLLSKFLVLD